MVSLSKLVQVLGGQTVGAHPGGIELSDVRLDSRLGGAGILFAALPGTRTDGAAFAADALAAGSPAVLSPSRLEGLLDRGVQTSGAWANWIHPEARRVAGEAAALVHGSPARQLLTIGITGTNGKTTVAYLVAQLLESEGHRPGIVGTVAVQLWGQPSIPATHTTPDAPELSRLCRRQLEAGGDSVVLEVSSHALDQERLAGIELDIAVFTNLGRDHLDYHSDLEAYAAAKARIFGYVRPGGTAIINNDDAFAPMMRRAAQAAGLEVVTFGIDTPSDLGATKLRVDPGGTNLTLEGMGIPRTGFRIPLVGRHNVENALASLCVNLTLGASPLRASKRLASLCAPPGRLEPVDVGDRGFRVFVDYAHTPDALRSVLSALRKTMGAPGSGRLLCVFGCGGERDRAKRAPMGEVVAELCDVALVTSDNPRGEDPEAILRDILQGLKGTSTRVVVQRDRRAAIRQALAEACQGDLILIAGKGHEAWQYLQNERRPFNDRSVVLEELC